MIEHLDGIFRPPFAPEDCSSVEWLETNGAGAFAGSSIIECNDRKYHGLLVTPIEGHEGRYHILSSVDAVPDCKVTFTTGTARYPDAYYPEGWKNIEQVSLAPIPEWIYSGGDCRLKKEIMMIEGEAAVYITYTLLSELSALYADLKFLFTFRDAHSLTRSNEDIDSGIEKRGNLLTIRPYSGLPAADIVFSGEWEQEGGLYWDYNICYESEKERGLEWSEDRFVPGTIRIRLETSTPFVIRVGIDGSGSQSAEDIKAAYISEKNKRIKDYRKPETGIELLSMQSRHFLLKNPSGKMSINAGYPWFGEWGRDTMIALPGLTFSCGRTEDGVKILEDYISMIKDGLLPNTLGETQGFTSYNSIDAGLLFCRAVSLMTDSGYGRSADEEERLCSVFLPAVEQIITAFLEGRVPEASLDENGMLWTGSSDTQLTWMDATACGKPVTPRYGYAVELNSLWYDALCLLNRLCRLKDEKFIGRAAEISDGFPEQFNSLFWLEEGYLSDTVNENGPDRKIRPNMLFATASANRLLDLTRCRAVVDTAEKHLLTELGLRTLSPEDPAFSPVYSGGADERDSKYHQGTVWPWPIGIMIESSLNCTQCIDKKLIFWSDYIENMLSRHLTENGWGSISEIFDGHKPGDGKGCFAQAWSCGEIIRANELINRVKRNERNKEG